MNDFIERVTRRAYVDPVRSIGVAFGILAVLAAVPGPPFWDSLVIVGIGLAFLWQMRRPNGSLRLALQRKYGCED